MSVYADATVYAKYLKGKLSSGCSECGEGQESSNYCDCCPPGLVSVSDSAGVKIGCLTPADAETYQAAAAQNCQEGYLMLFKNGTPSTFLGCVSEDQFAALYAVVNPA